MQIKTFVSDFLEVNSYVIEGSILIDPCIDYHKISKYEDFDLKAVILTHGHIDHIAQIESYLAILNLKFYMHKFAYDKLVDATKNLSSFIGGRKEFQIPRNRIVFINESSNLEIAGLNIKVLETPGHSNCSITIIIDDVMFSGDCLFRAGIGRTDFYSSNSAAMIDSLKKLYNLKQDYTVYPGHGESTTLYQEKLHNYYFQRR